MLIYYYNIICIYLKNNSLKKILNINGNKSSHKLLSTECEKVDCCVVYVVGECLKKL